MSSDTAAAAEVASLDGIIHAMYEVISGPAGAARDWNRFRRLYAPGARLMPVVNAAGEEARVRILSPEEYIERVTPIFAVEHFWERETSRDSRTFGQIAHVLSSYESLRDPAGHPFEHGINSVQLFNDSRRWWIASVMWNTSRRA